MFEKLMNDSANVGSIFAICVPVLLATTFASIEFSNATASKQQLKSATDAAALAGVNEAYIAKEQGVPQNKLEQVARLAAQKTFAAQTASLNLNVSSSIEVSAQVSGNRISIEAQYSGDYQLQSNMVMDGGKVAMGGKSRASASVPAYANVTLLFDNSASMGIGATTTDQALMSSHTNCAFACHFSRNWRHRSPERGDQSHDPSMSDYEFIHKLGAVTRLDVSKDGAIAGINKLKTLRLASGQVTVNIATFDNYLEKIVDENDSRASDLDYVKSKIENDVSFKRWHGGSNPDHAIRTLVNDLPDAGTGFTADDRAQYIVILTDGINNRARMVRPGNNYDDNVKWTYQRWSGQPRNEIYPNSPSRSWGSNNWLHTFDHDSTCSVMKDKGYQPIFILTNYMFPATGSHSNDSRFTYIDNTLQPRIAERMADCAGSNDFVISADTPQDIENAFERVFGLIASPLRLY